MGDIAYEPPKWAGKAPTGYHLDITKDGKLTKKMMIDSKPYYLFGRNMTMTDYCVDHASCSRVHAALVYHKHLNRFFLTDLGSTHGTFIGNVRLESQKPTPLEADANFHFGASTRIFSLREKPNNGGKDAMDESVTAETIPEDEFELDHLTEYNTVQNRQVSMVGITTDDATGQAMKLPGVARKRKSVQFMEEEDVINPEDVDPTVGRFRNLVSSTIVIPSANQNKKPRLGSSSDSAASSSPFAFLPRVNPAPQPSPSSSSTSSSSSSSPASSISHPFIKSLGISLPNPAPEPAAETVLSDPFARPNDTFQSGTLYDDMMPSASIMMDCATETDFNKKKYAKEAWPGRHGPPLANF